MGMNYYAYVNECLDCGRRDRLHIGKSSFGWVFTLHVYPKGDNDADAYIEDLDDWKDWLRYASLIVDEYDRPITYKEMMAIIELRSPVDDNTRAPIDGVHCIGHGPTYDLFVGDFS